MGGEEVTEEVSQVSTGKKWNRVIFRVGEDKQQLIAVERNSPCLTPSPNEGKVRVRRSNLTRGSLSDDDPDAISTVYAEDNGTASVSNGGAKDGTGAKAKKRKRVSKKVTLSLSIIKQAFKKAGKRIQWAMKKGCKGLGWCVIKIFNTNAAVYNQDSRTCVC